MVTRGRDELVSELPGGPRREGRATVNGWWERKRLAHRRYIAGPVWRARRKMYLESIGNSTAPYWCDGWCGRGDLTSIDVHHMTYDRANGTEADSDLMAVCRECHEQADEERREYARLDGWARKVHGYSIDGIGERLLGELRGEFEEWLEERGE